LGQRVKIIFDGSRDAGVYQTVLKAGDLPAGSYMIRLETPVQTVSHPVLVAR
jgi:hypothetical protein